MGLISVSTAFSRASSSPLAWDWYFSSVVRGQVEKVGVVAFQRRVGQRLETVLQFGARFGQELKLLFRGFAFGGERGLQRCPGGQQR